MVRNRKSGAVIRMFNRKPPKAEPPVADTLAYVGRLACHQPTRCNKCKCTVEYGDAAMVIFKRDNDMVLAAEFLCVECYFKWQHEIQKDVIEKLEKHGPFSDDEFIKAAWAGAPHMTLAEVKEFIVDNDDTDEDGEGKDIECNCPVCTLWRILEGELVGEWDK